MRSLLLRKILLLLGQQQLRDCCALEWFLGGQQEVENAAEDLLTMEGMDNQTARLLASKGVATMEDLAELAVDDLTEMTGMEVERAKTLIMTARAPWFA